MGALGTTWLECATELLRIWILNDGRFLLHLCFPMAIRYCWYIIHPRKKQLNLSLQLSILFIDAYSSFKWDSLDICRNLAAAAQGLPWIIYFSQKQDELYSAKHHVAMSVQIMLLRLSHFKIAQTLIPHCSLWDSYSAWTTFLVESNLNARNIEFWVTVKKQQLGGYWQWVDAGGSLFSFIEGSCSLSDGHLHGVATLCMKGIMQSKTLGNLASLGKCLAKIWLYFLPTCHFTLCNLRGDGLGQNCKLK